MPIDWDDVLPWLRTGDGDPARGHGALAHRLTAAARRFGCTCRLAWDVAPAPLAVVAGSTARAVRMLGAPATPRRRVLRATLSPLPPEAASAAWRDRTLDDDALACALADATPLHLALVIACAWDGGIADRPVLGAARLGHVVRTPPSLPRPPGGRSCTNSNCAS